MSEIFAGNSQAGELDYVACWYKKAADYMKGTNITCALVSTNSITQGKQVAPLWRDLLNSGIVINFAYRTFQWDSEASIKAHVHCVIIGFSYVRKEPCRLYSGNRMELVDHINAYLLNGPDIYVDSRTKPICNVPEMTTGNRPADGGHLIIEAEDYDEFIRKEPKASNYVKRLIGSAEFINNKKRWCLWLVGVSPAELRSMPEVVKRVEGCRQDRLNAPDAGRRKLADRPALFRETKNPPSALILPEVSSQNRRYVPMGYIDDTTICTNKVQMVQDAALYHFGVLTSNVHMAWMRAVCGRLKSDYDYSKQIVYNNFPWPNPTDEQKKRIEQTAQAILDARALYPDSSLADLYDDTFMPPELRTAHQNNDKAVMAAYGFPVKGFTESGCVAELMKLYQKLVDVVE